MQPPFELDHAPPIGVPEALAPGLRVVTAPNPGPMTFTGTRSYIVGEGDVAVIDPAPTMRATAPRSSPHSAVSGSRRSSSPTPTATTAPARAPSPKLPGRAPGARRPDRCALAGDGTLAGARRRRRRRPRLPPGPADRRGRDGERPRLDADRGGDARPHRRPPELRVERGERAFSGDQAMGWATTLISPPDGDLGAFRRSLARLQARPETVYYPATAPRSASRRPSSPTCSPTARRARRKSSPRWPGAGERRGAGRAHLCRRRPGAARRGRSQRPRPPDPPRRAWRGRGRAAAWQLAPL